MVKDQKLWRQIQLQYAKLREDEVGADLFGPVPPAVETERAGHGHDQLEEKPATPEPERAERPLFYREGLRRKHWVLTCCSLMVMCEWLDRSVLSICMEARFRKAFYE
eukprot:Skav205374  [mRNA]  locus=scaffold4386:131936:132259:- [translate_table: standard]